MIELYLGMAGLLLLGLIIVLLAARRNTKTIDSKRHLAAQQAFFRQRQRELQADLDNGLIDAEQLRELEQELKRQLVTETDRRPDFGAYAADRGGYYLLLVLLPVLALGLYQYLGYREDLALREAQRQIMQSEQVTEAQWQHFEDLVLKGLEKRADSSAHLAMMVSLRRQQGDFAGAVPYYRRLLQQFPKDPGLMAQLAQARYLSNQRRLDEEGRSLLEQALALDPQQPTALGVLGIDAFANGEYLMAIRYWQRLLPTLAAGSAEQQVIQQGLASAKQRAAEAGDLTGMEVEVTVAPALKEKPEGVLFVVAKSPDGNPMPVAALRRPVTPGDWPVTLLLSEADIIRPGTTLDDFESLILSAHVSRAGTAMRQPGDWVATGRPVEPGRSEKIQLKIDARHAK